jgi:ribosomal-protein-alanine N-acetyltransferase
MMTNFVFKIMEEVDLPQVLLTEASSHITPWKAKNFLDCIVAHYWNYVFIDQYSTDNFLGHCVVMPGFEEVHLLNITIHPSHRRKGIAQNAIKALEKTCLERNFQRILLEVRVSNLAAIHLYHQLGFEQIGVRKGYYPMPQADKLHGREDALVMQKNLIFENHS